MGQNFERHRQPWTPSEISKLSLFAGGSGQAFKFAPLIGDSLARLASGEQPAVDLSCWSHQRDAVRA